MPFALAFDLDRLKFKVTKQTIITKKDLPFANRAYSTGVEIQRHFMLDARKHGASITDFARDWLALSH
jgi:hypothetical protein